MSELRLEFRRVSEDVLPTDSEKVVEAKRARKIADMAADDAIEVAFEEFNNNRDNYGHSLAMTALGYYEALDEIDRDYVDAAEHILDITDHGERISMDDETWGKLFEHPDRIDARKALQDVQDELSQLRKNGASEEQIDEKIAEQVAARRHLGRVTLLFLTRFNNEEPTSLPPELGEQKSQPPVLVTV